MVEVFLISSAPMESRSSCRHSRETLSAGLPFFIWIGSIHTSRAPASMSRAEASAATSPVMSSMLASITQHVRGRSASFEALPRTARRIPGR